MAEEKVTYGKCKQSNSVWKIVDDGLSKTCDTVLPYETILVHKPGPSVVSGVVNCFS